jgi:hypothetical protein
MGHGKHLHPAGTARQRFGEPERVVIYVQALPNERDRCYKQVEAALRQLRHLPVNGKAQNQTSCSELKTRPYILKDLNTSPFQVI